MSLTRDRIAQWLLRANARLPLSFNHALGILIGTAFTWIPNKRIHTCRTNIRRCFPELSRREQNRMIRGAMRHAGRAIVEAGRMWARPPADNIALLRSIEGEELIQQALDQGRGVILATPHLGNWELAGSYVSSKYPLTIMYRPPLMTGLDDMIHEGRESSGGKYVPADGTGVRAQLKALNNGELIGLLPDQVPAEGGVAAPFFGLPALSMTLLSNLARKTNAVVIFCVVERLSWARGYRMKFLPPDEAITSADTDESVARVNAQVEKCILLCPDQYLWTYKRFKNTTPGFYPR
jgi:KDO2-lipid IV(A) lauroyltransferase